MRERLCGEIEVPGGGETKVVVPVVIPVVVDVQTLGIEVPDVHAVAVRCEGNCPLPSVPPEMEDGFTVRKSFPLFPVWSSGTFRACLRETSLESEQEFQSRSFFARYRDPIPFTRTRTAVLRRFSKDESPCETKP